MNIININKTDLFDLPTLKINAKEHFFVSGIKRKFELTAIVPLYLHILQNLTKIDRNKSEEFTIGSSTIVYQVDENEVIHLITGWMGSKTKTNFLVNKKQKELRCITK